MTTLTWLHLADTQFSSLTSKKPANDVIADIIQQRSAEQLRLDLIFITGDIASTGKVGEFKEAARFFQDLLSKTNVKRENIFFVPGNHDIDHGDRASIRALGNYNNFLSLFLGDTELGFSKEGQFLYYRRLQFAHLRVAILGLDTSWLDRTKNSGGNRDYKDFRQDVYQGLTNANDDEKIVLMHHSPDEFNYIDNGEISNYLKERCSFILHSHAHAQDFENGIQVGSSNRAVVINSGSDFRVEDHPNRYSIAQLDIETGKVTITKRTFDIRQGQWLQDGHPVNLQENPQSKKVGSDPILAGYSNDRFSEPDKSGIMGDVEAFAAVPASPQIDLPLKLQPKRVGSGPILAGYSNDGFSGPDRLGIMGDVEAFAAVLASRQIDPPLCLGLFGDWGSGKSFFMHKMQDRIAYLSKNAKTYEHAGSETAYCSNVIQITFNAWHYVDADLWASIISHIFDNLAEFISKEERFTQQAKLFQELQSAQQLFIEAREAQLQAEGQRKTAQNELEKLQRNREEKFIDLKQLRIRLFKTALNDADHLELKNALDQLSKELGITGAVETAEDVQKVIQEFGSLRGRLQAVLLVLTNSPDRWWRIFFFLAVLILIPVLPVLINYFGSLVGIQNVLGTIGAALTQIVAFIAGITFWASGLLSKASKVVGDLEKAKNKVDDIIKASRAEPGLEELELLQELSGLKEREEVAKQLLVETQQRIDQAKAEIASLESVKDGRKLAQFVRERITDENYRKRLGIVSLVRRDLQSLSDFLTSQNQKPSDNRDSIPRIDRIVLYIDDLDRCPEERVVEVLQAIHLLLAFKLFVVVVGVDSRWLLHSMKKAYPALSEGQQDFGLIDEEKLAWATTPQNYLEKIFQIPYNLQVMDKAGYENLVGSIMHPDETEKKAENATLGQRPDATFQVPDLPGEKGQSGAPVEDSAIAKQSIDEAIPLGSKQPESEETYGGIFDDQTPELLIISPDEEQFFKQLYALVPTPRSVKRIVNIYRLIRAKLPISDLPAFLGDDKTAGEFKPVLILLAILTGFQNEAPYVFRQINHSDDRTLWIDVIETILPHRKDGEAENYYNGILPDISKTESAAWRRLYFALKEVYKAGNAPSDTKPYRKWSQQVARFSFRLGKSFVYYGLPADVKIVSISVGDKKQVDECVLIENFGDSEEDLTGWKLMDQNKNEYVFPAFVLHARERVNIWSIAGKNMPTDLFWGRKNSIWNNTGDIAYLYDNNNVLRSNLRA